MQSEMSKTIIVTLVLDIEPQITLGGISEKLIGKLFILILYINYFILFFKLIYII